MTDPNPAGENQAAVGKFDLNAIVTSARSVITNPAAHFQSMPRTGGLVEPLIFIVVMAVATGIVSAILSFVGSPVGLLAYGLAAIIFIPIGALIGAFIGAGILFVIWKVMGSQMNYEASFRCLAAITAIYPITALLSILPYLGGIIGVAWGTWLLIEASVAVHGRERRTSQMVFGIIGAVLIFMNVSGEYAARHLSDQAEDLSRILEQYQK